jgi:predicted DCC family thiol-disulfide oxidoreductase YuxK
MVEEHTPAWLLFDGSCPFCDRYVNVASLREVAGPACWRAWN